jgi:myo-inositol-1(or 4)-monophosphatase
VALDWCWLAANRAQVYIHGRQSLWDYAAGALIFSESGGYARDFSGAALDYSPTSPLSVVAASNASIYKVWADYLAI